MAPPGSSRPSLTYTDQTLEASLPAITPCLKFRAIDFRSRRSIIPRYAKRKAGVVVMWNRVEILVSTDEWAKGAPVDVDTDSPLLSTFGAVFIVLAVACAVAWGMRLINRR